MSHKAARLSLFLLFAGACYGQTTVPVSATQTTRSEAGLTLDAVLRIARENNPTLKQMDAEIRAAQARQRQAGAWPNPTAGYMGEDLRGGAYRGGQHGAFIEQPLLLGGKLGAAKDVMGARVEQSRLRADEQQIRVENGVKLLFYRALAAQQSAQLRDELSGVGNEAVAVTRQLANTGQADQTDLLQAEIEAQQLDLAAVTAKAAYKRAWSELAASSGAPELPMQTLAGALDAGIPVLDPDAWAKSVAESPAMRIAASEVQGRQAEVTQAKAAGVPDMRVRAGLLQNRELLESSHRPVGLQGFVEVGVQVPLFNRNQDGVTAAQAEVERAELEAKRTALLLRRRSAALWQEYEGAREAVQRYREQILPRAKQAADLMAKKYGEMAASYPQVLVSRRTSLQMQLDYVAALDRLWTSVIELKSFTLADALETGRSAGSGRRDTDSGVDRAR